MNLRKLALVLFVLTTAALLAQEANQTAADFSLTDLQGRKLSLAEYKGKVILLDFWASWCVPCQAEIPRFIEWQKKYGPQGFQVIGLSMDDDKKPAQAFARRYKLNYPVAMGSEKIAESYGGVLGFPANIIIDRQGRVVAKHVGETDLNDLETEIKAALSQK